MERTTAYKSNPDNFNFIREKREKEVATLENKLLLESLPIMAWMASATGEIIYFNNRWEEFTGVDVLQDCNYAKIIHPDNFEEGQKKWLLSVSTGCDYVVEHRIRSKEGYYEWFLIKAVPLRNENGDILKWIGTSTSIETYKMSELRRDMFLNIASHELKTPLTSIKAYIQLLREMVDTDTPVFDYLNRAHRNTEKLNRRVSELLEVFSIQPGNMVLNKEKFYLDEVVRKVIDASVNTSPGHEIILTGQTDQKITGDKGKVGQMISNLLTNALKYSSKADKIVIHLFQNIDHVILEVTDFGIGVPHEELGKLFDPFYRAEGVAKSVNGWGLGLYLSQEIARAHEGKISASSEVGKGSTFKLELPVYHGFNYLF